MSEKDKDFTAIPGEKKIVLLSKQRGLPPLMLRLLKKTPVGVTVTVDPLHKKNASDDDHMPNGFYSLKGDRIHITTADPHVLAHELGHAKSDESLSGRVIQSRFLYPMIHLSPLAGLISGLSLVHIKHPVAKAVAIGAPFLMAVPALAAEAKASANGHEILRNSGASEKVLADYRKKMAGYFLTYASRPLTAGVNMIGGAAYGHALRELRKMP